MLLYITNSTEHSSAVQRGSNLFLKQFCRVGKFTFAQGCVEICICIVRVRGRSPFGVRTTTQSPASASFCCQDNVQNIVDNVSSGQQSTCRATRDTCIPFYNGVAGVSGAESRATTTMTSNLQFQKILVTYTKTHAHTQCRRAPN